MSENIKNKILLFSDDAYKYFDVHSTEILIILIIIFFLYIVYRILNIMVAFMFLFFIIFAYVLYSSGTWETLMKLVN